VKDVTYIRVVGSPFLGHAVAARRESASVGCSGFDRLPTLGVGNGII
jgi:hypothetical protein